MRHFQLLRFLAFTTCPDSLHSSHAALQQSTQQQQHHRQQKSSPTSGATSLVRKLSSAVESHSKIAQAVCEEERQMTTRRRALQSIFAAGGSLAFVGASNALDMDAFVNAELESDTKNCDPKRDPKCKPKLSDDEALCQYGQSGNARGEACKRVKAAGGSLPKPGSQGKSLGGAYAM